MAAYAAVVSLQHTINAFLSSSLPHVSSIREILESANKEASSLLQALEALNGSNRSRSSMERVDALEALIRDSAHKLEDVLEFHELKQLEEEEKEEDGYEEGVIRQEIRSFGEAAKRLEKEYLAELSREDYPDDDEDVEYTDFGVGMIGRSRLFNTILQRHVLRKMRPDDMYLYPFWGEEGSGSRVVAKTFFKNARQSGKFERCGWARVGGYGVKRVLMRLISQVEGADVYDESLVGATDDRLSEYLYKALENRSYIIVLDGVDDVELLNYLRSKSFPDQSNGSVILVTTTSRDVALSSEICTGFQMAGAFEEDFWLLIRNTLFGWESIPMELEVAGKEIVHNTRLLALTIAKTLIFLSKSDKTVEQWRKIAADKDNTIFTVSDEISEIVEILNETPNWDTGAAQQASPFLDFTSKVEGVNMKLFPKRFFSKMQIISFFGMVGIGKTTLVRNLFKDNSTLNRYDHHVWIHIGPRYRTKEILIDILTQIYPNTSKLCMTTNEKLVGDLCSEVSGMRCLIVLDDLCSQDPLHHLIKIFPGIRGTILVTTRLPKVAEFGRDDTTIEIQLLGDEESWCLLCKKVFGKGLCPPELEKVGRKIAKRCDGLPLLILTVADQLLKVEQSEEYWNNIASGKEKSVFKNAHHHLSETLLPTYHNLPQHLKPCFLYLGVFLERSDIPISNLSNLWISEGFLKPNLSQIEDASVVECLSELVDISLVMVRRNVSSSPITTCRLHSVFWHLSNNQGMKSKFFHAMNSYDDCSIESMTRQRRLCIRENILLSMKNVQKSMSSNTSAHSFLCVGQLHQYPVPLNFDLRLLRVMNTLTIRLYEFPNEVTSLFHLRYLSFTCNGELSALISKLQKLQCLIVKRYMNIKSSKISSYLPTEIWDMKELEHLQIMGGCLPNNIHGSRLLKLSTLLDVSVESCRDEVFKWIPNLKRLGLRIDVTPTDESNSLYNLNDIYHLERLESFKCVVVNPHIQSKPIALISMFPQNLKKLSLSGLGYPWNHISTIGKLKNLEVLKLKCYAFQGPEWEMDSTNQFGKLKFLLLEDTNLVKWKLLGNTSMPLKRLSIKHCYKLQEFPITIGNYLERIEIVDCNSLLVNRAKDIGQPEKGCEVDIHCSWFADARKR